MNALKFGAATSDVVNHGTGVLPDQQATGTYWAWIYPTSLNLNKFIMSQNTSGGGRVILLRQERFTNATQLELFVVDTGGVNGADYTSQVGFLTLNTWQLVVATWDISLGAGLKIKMYRGTPLTPMIPATMSVIGEGAGNVLSYSGGNFVVGNNTTGSTAAFQGSIAKAGAITRVLTPYEVEDLRTGSLEYPPVIVPGTKLFARYGESSPVTDLSGNGNAGTITGATAVAGIPEPELIEVYEDRQWLDEVVQGLFIKNRRTLGPRVGSRMAG